MGFNSGFKGLSIQTLQRHHC